MCDTEKLFATQEWVTRCEPAVAINNHISFASAASDRVRKTVPCELDVSYGDTRNETLDIFGTDLPPGSPIFIYLHGGYWHVLRKNISCYSAEALYKNGVKTIILGFDSCPQVTVPEIFEQAKRAIKFCMEYAQKMNARFVSLGGHSAGATLLALAFKEFFITLPHEQRRLLDRVFYFSGLFDVIPLLDTSKKQIMRINNEQDAKDISPLYQEINGCDHVEFYVTVGEQDSPAFIEQAEQYSLKLRKLNIVTHYTLMKDTDHFQIVEGLNSDIYVLTKLIINN